MEVKSRYTFSGGDLAEIFRNKLGCIVNPDVVDPVVTLLLSALQEKKEPDQKKIIHVWVKRNEPTAIPESGKNTHFEYSFENVLPSTVEYNAHVVVWIEDWEDARETIIQILEREPNYLEVVSLDYPAPALKAAIKDEFPFVNIYTIAAGDLEKGLNKMQEFFERTEPRQRGLRERGDEGLDPNSLAELRQMRAKIKILERELEQEKVAHEAAEKSAKDMQKIWAGLMGNVVDAEQAFSKTTIKEELQDDADGQADLQENNRKRHLQCCESGDSVKRHCVHSTDATDPMPNQNNEDDIILSAASSPTKNERPKSPVSERRSRSPVVNNVENRSRNNSVSTFSRTPSPVKARSTTPNSPTRGQIQADFSP